MARRTNDLFIGAQHLNIEGREIKHPALIKLFATINLNKISDDPMEFIGMDLETNADNGTLKLLGFWDGSHYYHYYNETFISILYSWVKNGYKTSRSIVYWNRLDPFVLYKQFLNYVKDPALIQLSMEKFSKVSGEWDKEYGQWIIKPIVEVEMQNGVYFGIKNVIRSNIQFFYRRANDTTLYTVWAYDVAQLYQEGLETTAMGKKDKKTGQYKYTRLSWYTKIDQSAHIVDWDRFETDQHYKENIVLKSNMYDSRAVYELAHQIQQEFYEAFKFYPRTLISQGSIARAGIVATLKNMHGDNQVKILEDVRSIGIVNYLDNWHDTYGEDFVKDLLCLMFESYSGGQIEAYMYGYSEEAFMTDLTQAYPYHIEHLWDLRGATITKGEGTPPHIKNSYCLIRGDVDIPIDVDYHPLTIKHPLPTHKETNIRATGKYRASYLLEERDFLVSLGAKFTNEEWYNIETKGELSPLAKVCKIFTDLRAQLKPLGKDYIAKISSASLYGILFEAVNTWIEQNLEIFKDGYRGGEFLNPLYATIITAKTRIQVSQACNVIKSKGGLPILVMTDSVFWNIPKTILNQPHIMNDDKYDHLIPKSMIKEVKTVGYFEPVKKVRDLVCLGSGRYGYKDDDGYVQAKKRGLNAVDIHDPQGIIKEEFNWLNALKILKRTKEDKIKIKVRALISVGMILSNHKYTYKDLGRIVEEYRDVDVIVGKAKRLYEDDIKDPSLLADGLIQTDPIFLGIGMDGTNQINDQTLPKLRELLMKQSMTTRKEKRKEYRKTAVKNYFDKNGDKIKAYRKQNYEYLKQYGYSSKERNKMQSWSMEKIQLKLMEDDKL